jgi:hypothetical protein
MVLVSIFIVDAGISGVPAFSEKSVSPRVSETAMMPNWPLRILPAIDVMSLISEATVRGAVELTAGAAGTLRAPAFRVAAFFLAAARLRVAELVVLFFDFVWEETGIAAIDASTTTAII